MAYKDSAEHKKRKHEYYLRNKEKAKDNVRKRRKEYIVWFEEIKSHLECKECGNNHPAVLDFHHRNPDEKESVVSALIASLYPKKKILAEIAKCDIFCANCHRIYHWNKHKNLNRM